MAIKGQLFVIAAPSGAGKTTLVAALVERMSHLKVSVSFTTRPMRTGEQDGVNYFFVDQKTFAQMVEQDAFLEHATVHGHSYGTSKDWLDEQISAGQDVILEIDWQGAAQVKQKAPKSCSIFILPPSPEALRDRLVGRGQDSMDVIERRLAAASDEMSHVQEFDYMLVNDDFEQTLHQLCTVFQAEQLKTSRQGREKQDLLQRLLVNN